MGFIIEQEEMEGLVKRNARSSDVLFPYLNGDDLNSRPDQSPSRWVINFFDWPLDRDSARNDYEGPVAADYPECLALLEERVRQERVGKGGEVAKSPWWQFWRPRPALYTAIKGFRRVLVGVQTSKYLSISFEPSGVVYSHMTNVFGFEDGGAFAILNATWHSEWILTYCSKLETRLRYLPTDGFETFPFPKSIAQTVSDIGDQYDTCRREVMRGRQEGLTKTYNRFHDPDEASADIKKLRDLHVEMDHAVAAAYGWTDLDLGHGFHETKQGVRFTISEPARREVLQRLLKLNHERYAEEVKQGLHDKKKSKAKKPASKKKPSKKQEASLFDGEDAE